MNKKLYIELLEAEVVRQRGTISSLNYKLDHAREEFDPFYKAAKNLSTKMEHQIYGLSEMIKDTPPPVDNSKPVDSEEK